MIAFIRASWRYALLSAGLCVVMGLSLYAGAVVGNWLVVGLAVLALAYGLWVRNDRGRRARAGAGKS